MCKFEQVSSRTVLDSGQQTVDRVGQLDREQLDKLLALKVKSVGVEHAQFGWAGTREGVEGQMARQLKDKQQWHALI